MTVNAETLLPSGVVGVVIVVCGYAWVMYRDWRRDRRESAKETSDERSSRVTDEATRTAVLLNQIAGMQKSIDWQQARITQLETALADRDTRIAALEVRAADFKRQVDDLMDELRHLRDLNPS